MGVRRSTEELDLVRKLGIDVLLTELVEHPAGRISRMRPASFGRKARTSRTQGTTAFIRHPTLCIMCPLGYM